MIFLFYIDTLEPETHAVYRSPPLGWVSRSRERDAREEAAHRWPTRVNQVLLADRTTATAITKVTKRQATAVKRGADASFAECYQAMLLARKVARAELRPRMMQKFSMDAMLPGL